MTITRFLSVVEAPLTDDYAVWVACTNENGSEPRDYEPDEYRFAIELPSLWLSEGRCYIH